MKKTIVLFLSSICSLAAWAGEEIKLTLVDEEVVFKYTPSSGDWYFGAADQTGKYSVHLDYLTDKAGKYGTYTEADLDPLFSFVRQYTYDGVQDCAIGEGSEFTFAEAEGYYTLEGRLLCDDGNTYVVEGQFEKHVPLTFDVEGQHITYLDYGEEEKDWYLRFKNDDFKITFDLLSADGTFTGTYTEADAFGDGSCFVTDLHADEDMAFESFTVTLQQFDGVSHPVKGCEITGTATAENGDIYNFHMVKYPPIKPIREVEVAVELTTAEWPSEERVQDGCYYELTETENPDATWMLACYRLLGEVTEEEIDTTLTACINTASGEMLKLDNGKVTQSLDADAKSISVRAELVMSDSVQYNFTFVHPISVNESRTYTFTDLWVDTSLAEYGSISLNASNDLCSMNMSLAGAEVPGIYDDREVYISMTVRDAEGYDNYIDKLALIDAECTLADDGTPVLDCRFIGNDWNVYTIKASFVLPEIADTLCLQITGASVWDATDEMGGFTLSYNTEDYDMICTLGVLSGDKLEGHYGIEQLDNSSFLLLTDADGTQHTLRFYSGEFDVTCSNDALTLTGAFQAGTYYLNLTITTADSLPAAIREVKSEGCKSGNAPRYNLYGQRVGAGYRGISVSNGKKYID